MVWGQVWCCLLICGVHCDGGSRHDMLARLGGAGGGGTTREVAGLRIDAPLGSLVLLALQASLLALLAGGISHTSCMNDMRGKVPRWSEETTTTNPHYQANQPGRAHTASPVMIRDARLPAPPATSDALTGGEQGDQGRQEDERPHGGRPKVWPSWRRKEW